MNTVKCQKCGSDVTIPDGQYFGVFCGTCDTKSFVSTKNKG